MTRMLAFKPLRFSASLLCPCLCMILCACANLSGYDSKDSFSCKAPDGVLCASMTGIYANAQQNNLPGQTVHQQAKAQDLASARSDSGMPHAMTPAISSGTPIRSAPRILRLWFAPWEDSDGDLHDQSYVYLSVDTGKWQIEHTRRRFQDAYRPVRAPVALPKDVQGSPQSGKPSQPSVNESGEGAPGPVGAVGIPSAQAAAELLESLRARTPAGATCAGGTCATPSAQ